MSLPLRRATQRSNKQPGNPAASAVLIDAIVTTTSIAEVGVTLAGRLHDSPAGSPVQLS